MRSLFLTLLALAFPLAGDGAEHTFRILGLFEPERAEEFRRAVETIPELTLVKFDYPSGLATIRLDDSKTLPGARKGEPLAVSFDRILRLASRSTFEALPPSGFSLEMCREIEIPISGLDCRGCAYGVYLAVCKLDGVERVETRIGEDGRVTAWIDSNRVSVADLEEALVAKGVTLNYRIEEAGLIPREEIQVVRFSSEERGSGLDQKAGNAVDGNPATLWRTKHLGEERTEPPHELVLDLGRTRSVSGFRYLPAQFRMTGQFAETEFQVGDDPEAFGEKLAARAILDASRSVHAIRLESPIAGRYVRVRVLSTVDDGPVATAAEIAVVCE